MKYYTLEKIIIFLLLLFVVTQPLYTYSLRIAGIGLSLDRVILFAAFLLFVISCVNARKISLNYFPYILFLLIFTTVNAIFSTGENNVMLPSLFSILIVLLFSEVRYTEGKIHVAINLGFCFYLVFSFYSLFHFLQTGTNLVYKPFYQYLPLLDSALMPKAEEMAKGFSLLPSFNFHLLLLRI